jgi:hypothetical protein
MRPETIFLAPLWILVFAGDLSLAFGAEITRDVKFELPDDLPPKGWRGRLRDFALVKPFRVKVTGWARIKFSDSDTRWASLDESTSVTVELWNASCDGLMRVEVPKDVLDAPSPSRPVKIRSDEAAEVSCRGPEVKLCSIEVREAGTEKPHAGVSIRASRGRRSREELGRTGADGRWIGSCPRDGAHLSAWIVPDDRLLFDVRGELKESVDFCRGVALEREIFHVVPAETTGSTRDDGENGLFRPGAPGRAADGL